MLDAFTMERFVSLHIVSDTVFSLDDDPLNESEIVGTKSISSAKFWLEKFMLPIVIVTNTISEGIYHGVTVTYKDFIEKGVDWYMFRMHGNTASISTTDILADTMRQLYARSQGFCYLLPGEVPEGTRNMRSMEGKTNIIIDTEKMRAIGTWDITNVIQPTVYYALFKDTSVVLNRKDDSVYFDKLSSDVTLIYVGVNNDYSTYVRLEGKRGIVFENTYPTVLGLPMEIKDILDSITVSTYQPEETN